MQINITKEQFCAIGKEYQALYDKSEAYCKQVESISLGDFIVENVSEQPFYTRYNEFVNVFTRHGIDDFEQLFAEPSHDVATQKIEWYIPEQEGGWKGEWPICYANIPDEG
jgi:hypothetical protein